MGKFHYFGPGFGCDPNDDGDDKDALREIVLGNLSGSEISEEAAIGDFKGMDTLYLLAVTLNDEAEIGRLFVKHAKAAADRIVERRVAQ